DTLVKGRFLVDDNMDELKILKLRNNISRFNSEGTALVIAPTLHCPLECRYCYVDRDKAAMDRPTIDALKKFYLKRIERSQGATVCWTGGEPLLVLDTVEELNSFFLHEAKERNKPFQCSMVTSGYLLTAEIIERLKQCGIVKLQVTLDGCREYHDRLRYTPGGGKTYDRIMANLVTAVNSGLKITLRSNINKDNYDGIFNLIDHLDEVFKDKDNLVFAPCMVTEVKEVKSFCPCNVYTNKEFSRLEPGILYYALQKGFKIGTEKLSTHRTFCGANTLSLQVIDPQANILKCWCNLGRADKNRVGYIKEDGEIVYADYQALAEWMDWNPFEIEDCLKCKVLPICMGGCMYHNLMGETDAIDMGCTHRKHNIEEILKLFYLSRTQDVSRLNEINLGTSKK
ncbi:MAG: uncharacterized protein QG657_3828, partial [Acidobacteriota bacterium]|nr:uncharacterized protein [Acidobacteriota bacterium]